MSGKAINAEVFKVEKSNRDSSHVRHGLDPPFNGAETNCRIAHNLGILLMNNNGFSIFFSSILVMSVQISTWVKQQQVKENLKVKRYIVCKAIIGYLGISYIQSNENMIITVK